MTLEGWREALLTKVRHDPGLLRYITLKLPATHLISSNGCVTYGDPASATEERGQALYEAFVAAMVAFIKVWQSTTHVPTKEGVS